jgi:glycosyltransferase involved in cell wall biosynthesis
MAHRVLVLAKHFPPTGGAGVHRTVGTVRYLADHGYEPVVVTGPGERVDRWSPSDPGLLGRIPADVEVHRLEGTEPTGQTGLKGKARNALRVPPSWVPWWIEGAIEIGTRVGAGADLVLASGNPYYTADAGAEVARRLGVPWIVDLEDPWAFDEMRVHPTMLHHRAELRWMRRSLRTVSAVITCAEEAAVRIRHGLPELSNRPIVNVPIGFDRDDFPPAEHAERDDDKFRIVHTGTMHTALGLRHRATRNRRRLLGGTSVDVDILTRSPVFLLEAVEALIARDPGLADRIEVHLAGQLTGGDREVADRYPFVRTPGLLAHAETVALMRSADLLFLPMHEMAPGQRAGLVPYKTYEYLAAERPILAAVPEGDTRDILAGVSHATLCRPSDVEAMATAIREAVARGPVERVRDGIDSPALAPYERRAAVAEIAGVLDLVLRTPERRAAAQR